MKYFDATYLVRIYLDDPGWERVRELAALDHLACCLHGKAEVIAAFHRKFREGHLDRTQLGVAIEGFEYHCEQKAYHWLPLSEGVVTRVSSVYRSLPAGTALRSADAIHLGCAAENGFAKIYSNDRRLLLAATHFAVNGIDVI